jgi:hypothetical protein
LQWGACEAISLGKPVITSDWPFLKEYFHKGTVHVDNSIEGIYQGVVQLRQEWERYDQEAKELRQERQLEWAQKQAELMRMIHQATDTA